MHLIAQGCDIVLEKPRIANTTETGTEAELALWRLAERLYEVMDRLDPSGITWEQLDQATRELFYFSIKSVLLEHGDVLRVLRVNVADDDMIARGLHLRE